MLRFHKPSPTWSVKAASVAGTSHREAGVPCQDAHDWSQLPGGWFIAAVADGAGSARKADAGARIACRTAVQTLAGQRQFPPLHQEQPWQAIFAETFNAAALALEAEAVEQQTAVAEFGTTLILLAASPQGVAAAQIGDGAVVIADGNRAWSALTIPRGGEYYNETLFLHSHAAIDQAQIRLWQGAATCVALLTDGLQRLALNLPGGSPHAPFFDPLWNFVRESMNEPEAARQLSAFLQSPRIAARTEDDLTLVLAGLQEVGG